ncbi:MAG TPA: hypothetical protein VFA15_06070, partial [Nitrososphaera sp.]|nr:hypothetical protein [Nitrososphaera sp.]
MRLWFSCASRRAREVLHAEGLLGLLVHGLRRSCRPLIEIRRFLFFETDLTQPLPPIPPARVPLDVHPLRADE